MYTGIRSDFWHDQGLECPTLITYFALHRHFTSEKFAAVHANMIYSLFTTRLTQLATVSRSATICMRAIFCVHQRFHNTLKYCGNCDEHSKFSALVYDCLTDQIMPHLLPQNGAGLFQYIYLRVLIEHNNIFEWLYILVNWSLQ